MSDFIAKYNGARIPTDTDEDSVSYVMQSKHGKDAECDLGSYEKSIIETWNLNNPDSQVPADYKWGGIHDQSILQYVIAGMKYNV